MLQWNVVKSDHENSPEPETMRLSGALTYLDVEDINRALRMMLTMSHQQEILLDLSTLDDIDCAALAMLMRVHDEGKRHHTVLKFLAPHGRVREKLQQAANVNHLKIIDVAC